MWSCFWDGSKHLRELRTSETGFKSSIILLPWSLIVLCISQAGFKSLNTKLWKKKLPNHLLMASTKRLLASKLVRAYLHHQSGYSRSFSNQLIVTVRNDETWQISKMSSERSERWILRETFIRETFIHRYWATDLKKLPFVQQTQKNRAISTSLHSQNTSEAQRGKQQMGHDGHLMTSWRQ